MDCLEEDISTSDDNIDLKELISSVHLPFTCSVVAPLKGELITMDNLVELDKTHVVLDKHLVSDLFSIDVLNGSDGASNDDKVVRSVIDNFGSKKRKLILVTPKVTISDDDSFLDIIRYKYPPSWHYVFESCNKFLVNTVNRKLKSIEDEYRQNNPNSKIPGYLPLKKDIFRAFQLCPFNRVKVVIIGQDPYARLENGHPQACGLSFAVKRGFNTPRSLIQVHKELTLEYSVEKYVSPFEDKKKKKVTKKTEHESNKIIYTDKTPIPYTAPDHGDLSDWARQGVLLLNMSLTTELNISGAHKGLWDAFISEVIRAITRYHSDIVFLLWGADARRLKTKGWIIGKHHILECAHPAAEAHGNIKSKEPFIESWHFRETNKLLIEAGKEPINWEIAY